MPISTKVSKRTQFWIRLVVSLTILGLILSKVDYTQLAQVLPTASPLFLLLGFSFLVSDRLIMAYRWNLLIEAKGIAIPFIDIVKIYFVSFFLGLFMPSSVAPDFIRVYLATKHHCSTPDALSSVFIDRFVGLITLALMAFLASSGIYLFSGDMTISPWIIGVTVCPLIVSVLFIILMRYDFFIFYRFNSSGIIARLLRILSDFRSSITSYRGHLGALKRVALVSLCNHAVFVLTTYAAVLALHIESSLPYLCVIVPLISLLTMVPISLAGLGIQEGAYVYFLTQAGIAPQSALAVAILVRIINTLGCLPGGILYLLGTQPVTENAPLRRNADKCD